MLEGLVGEGDAARRTRASPRAPDPRRRAPGGRPSPTSSSVSASRRQTRIRDRSAALTSKYGFSVVAPISVIVPSSTCGSKRVLLGLVEAMDLVEEQDGPRAVERQPVLRLGDRGPDLGDARHDRRERREVGTDLVGEQAGEARLAGAGRAPQEQRRRGGRGRRSAAAGRARRRGGPGRRTRRGRADASARRGAAARAVAGRAPRAGPRSGAGRSAWPDGSAVAWPRPAGVDQMRAGRPPGA